MDPTASNVTADGVDSANDLYNHAYAVSRFSPQIENAMNKESKYARHSRSRSPDRSYQAASLKTSSPENHQVPKPYSNSDAPSLAQRDPNVTHRDFDAPDNSSQSTLYVRNIPLSATEEQISEIFQQHGTVESCTFLHNHQTGRPRGVAFVKMVSNDDAENALVQLHDCIFESRALTIERAKLDNPREKTPGLYKGRYPTRQSDRNRSGDSYRSASEDMGRGHRDAFRSVHGRRADPFIPSGQHSSRYPPSRVYEYERSSPYPLRGGRSPPRGRGGRHGAHDWALTGMRDSRVYDRPHFDRFQGDFRDRQHYQDRPPSRFSRDAAPRYHDGSHRGPPQQQFDSRFERAGPYSASHEGNFHSGYRRRP